MCKIKYINMIITKKGRTAKFNRLGSIKCQYGTVDCLDFKSVYLVIQCWIEPKKETENWIRIVNGLDRAIKHTVSSSIDTNIMKDKFICDLDLRWSGMKMDKRSFLNLEINLFIDNNEINFKSKELKDALMVIANNVANKHLNNNQWFSCHQTKKKSLMDNF